MPSKAPPIPSCPYHATVAEKLAVRLLGGAYAAQIATYERMRATAKDPHTQKMLWTDTRAQYRLAVAAIQKRKDCPEILRLRPNRKE
jgi:hypothetical protein